MTSPPPSDSPSLSLPPSIIQLRGLRIQPLFEGKPISIHPAIGIAGDRAYVGIWIPCLIVEEEGESENEGEGKGGGKGAPKATMKDLLFLITSDRKAILANEEILKDLGWRLAYKPLQFENRWSLEDVRAWLNGSLQAPKPKEVLEALLEAWKTYIDFEDPREYLYRALWDIGSYFFHLFASYPYEYLGGVKRSGKTKALMLHKALAFNAVLSNNMSTASLYRLIQNARCTLLIDESEKLATPERAQEFRSILLAGYKSGERVYRVEKNAKERLVPEAFDVYSPKALANIGGLEDVLEDRVAHPTFMKRSLKVSITNRDVRLEDPLWSRLRSLLYAFFLSHWKGVLEVYEGLREAMAMTSQGSSPDPGPGSNSKSSFDLGSSMNFSEHSEKSEASGLHGKIHGSSELSELGELGEHRGKGIGEIEPGSEDEAEAKSESEQITTSVFASASISMPILTSRELELWLPILSLAYYFDVYGNVNGNRDNNDKESPSNLSSPSSLSSPKFTKLPCLDGSLDSDALTNASSIKFTSPSLSKQSKSKHSPSLFASMLSLALESARDRQIEDATETREAILVQSLQEIVEEDGEGYIAVRKIKDAMAKRLDDPADWLTNRWLGRALRRLGFKEKRRLGTGYEYRLTVSAVRDLAKRFGISTETSETPLTPVPMPESDAEVTGEEAEVKEESGEEVEKKENKKNEEDEKEKQRSPSPRLLPERRQVFFYRPIPSSSPSEPCELCGTRPVEYELEMPGEGILRRCGVCFSKLRRDAHKAEWVRLGRTEDEGEGKVSEAKLS